MVVQHCDHCGSHQISVLCTKVVSYVVSANPWADILKFLGTRVPKVVEQVEGAAVQDIRKLEKLHGQPLPELYSLFLRSMGTSTGGFNLLNSVDFGVETVLEFLPEMHPKTYPVDRFLRIGIDTGESGTSEITDLYIDLAGCSELNTPLAGLDRYDEDDDPEPYEAGDELSYSLDLWSRGVVSAAHQGWAEGCEFHSEYTVKLLPDVPKGDVFAELCRFSGRREMSPVLAPAPRALAVAKGPTLWVIRWVEETRCRLTLASNDVEAARADAALLNDYFVLNKAGNCSTCSAR